MIFQKKKEGFFIKIDKHFFCGYLWERGSRDTNEDSLVFWHIRKGKKHKIMAVICDGIGGLPLGEEASSYAVRQLANWFTTEGYRLKISKQKKILQQLCFQIHKEIKVFGKEKKIQLGTTIAVVLVENKKVYWFYTGDCRLYLIRNTKVRKLTKEHHDNKGNLNRAIGIGEWYLLCEDRRRIRKGDRFLLCTDGFYRNLDREELRIWGKRKVESDGQADRMLKQIFQKKINSGERDNISALYFGYME